MRRDHVNSYRYPVRENDDSAVRNGSSGRSGSWPRQFVPPPTSDIPSAATTAGLSLQLTVLVDGSLTCLPLCGINLGDGYKSIATGKF